MEVRIIYIYLPYNMLINSTDKRVCKLLLDLLKFKLLYPHRQLGHVLEHKNPIKLVYDNNSLSFISQSSHLFNLKLLDADFSIDIKFSPQKPIALVGSNGKPDKLYYYSFTRNHLQGHIMKRGSIEIVRGQGWFDHQWGRNYSLTFKEGWDWFGIQLIDARELLLNQFFLIKNKEKFGPMANLVENDGSLKFTRNIQFDPVKYWQSPYTGALYPLEWNIIIPDFNMQLYVQPNFCSQEMPVFGHLQAIWEGACLVSGEEGAPAYKTKKLVGKGFMELVGYANHVTPRQ